MPKSTVPTYDGFCVLGSAGNSIKLTIRAPFAQELGVRVGDTVLCRVVDGALVIRPVNQLLEDASRAFEARDRDAVRVAQPVSLERAPLEGDGALGAVEAALR